MYPPLVVVGDPTSPLGEVGVGGVVLMVSRGGVGVPVEDGIPESESGLGLGLGEEEGGSGRGKSGSIWSAGIE